MALNFSLLSTPLCPLPRLAYRKVQPKSLANAGLARTTKCIVENQTSDPVVVRRSGNYHPTSWDYALVQSLASDYKSETYVSRRDKLKEDVRHLLEEVVETSARIELIDDLHRLGVGYIFEKEINGALQNISITNYEMSTKDDLHYTAIRFRILRQHGFEVSQDVFNSFKDEKGSFKRWLCDNPKGLLSLYEASHLALEGETILDEAREFARRNLKSVNGNIRPEFAEMVNHALEEPVYWRPQRLEARWYVDEYEKKEDMNPILLELAKLDYNMVQAAYQEEIKVSMRWWNNLGIGEKLSFSRDRLTECFLWAIGISWHPKFSWGRIHLAKVNQLITTLDDVYDLYGTVDELELFTDAVDRWDVNSIERLPEYLKICFLALYNSVNEMGYEILKVRGTDAIPYLKKMWAGLCNAYFQEAKWYSEGYKPSFEEYLKNALESISVPVILGHAYMCVTQDITKEALDYLNNGSDIIYGSSMVLRLMDDLGTYMDEEERGDIPKSIQCYMHDAGVSEAVARNHIKGMVSDVWKKMNKEVLTKSRFPRALIDCATNFARMSQCYYQYGDGFGVPNKVTNDRVIALLVEPIPLLEK